MNVGLFDGLVHPQVAILLAFLVPVLVSFLRSHESASWVASALTFGLSFVAVLLSWLLDNKLNPGPDEAFSFNWLLSTTMQMLVVVTVLYQLLYKALGIADELEKRGLNIGKGTGATPGTDTSHKLPEA